MNDTNNTNKVPGCLNGFTKDTIEKEFYATEDTQDKCDKCEHLTYKNGIGTCEFIT